MNEKEPSEEKIKEPRIQKFYNACELIQNISLGGIIVSSFLSIYIFLKDALTIREFLYLPIAQALNFLFLIGFLTSILFIIIGIAFYFNRTNKIKKRYGKKFIMRGIILNSR